MIKSFHKSFLAAAAVFAGLGAAASAQVISVNFSASSAPFGFGPFYLLGASETAGVVAVDNWNNYTTTSGVSGALVDNSGASTTATVEATGSPDHWGFYSASGGDQRMLGGFLEKPFGSFGLEIADVPYALYDLYVYAGPSADRIGQKWSVTLGSTTFYGVVGDPTALPSGTFIQSTATAEVDAVVSNYAVFTGLTASDLTLSFGGSGINAPSLSGIQLAQVPEPSAALLGLVGALGLGWRRRR